MIRVGILGCATIAKRSLAPAFSSHAEFDLRAIASRSVEKAREFASQYGARPCSYEELVDASDVDLVYCPLPTGMHYEWALRALMGGKHVLCEKSLACSLAQVQNLVALARRKNCLLMESFQFRFHAQNRFVKEMVASGAIGKMVSMKARFSFPKFSDPSNIRFSKALGGGALLDAGAYVLKASTYFLGSGLKVESVQTSMDPTWKVDKDGEVMLRSPQTGAVSHASYSMDSEYECGYSIVGTKGEISSTRAYTARADFDAEIFVNGVKKVFRDDHFARLLDYVAEVIYDGNFEREFAEDLEQARLVNDVSKRLGYDLVNRFAIFGHHGYLGSQLTAYFISKGIPCDGYDMPGADVTQDDFWHNFDPVRYSVILFFAGLTGAASSNANALAFNEVNEGGMRRLLARLSVMGHCVPKVIFPSTRLVYRGSDVPVTEDSAKECKTVYARNKLNCEKMLAAAKSVPSTVLRICVPYGNIVAKDYSYGTIGFMLKQAASGEIRLFGDGAQRRTFTHVEDICRAVEYMAVHQECEGIYNVGGEDYSLCQVAEMIAAVKSARVISVPWPEEARRLESGSTVFDSRRIDALLENPSRQHRTLSEYIHELYS